DYYDPHNVSPDVESNETEQGGGGINAAVESSNNYYIAVIGLEPVNEYTVRFIYTESPTTTTTSTTTATSTTTRGTSTTTTVSPTTTTTRSTSFIFTTSPATTAINATTTAPSTQASPIPDYDGPPMLTNVPSDKDGTVTNTNESLSIPTATSASPTDINSDSSLPSGKENLWTRYELVVIIGGASSSIGILIIVVILLRKLNTLTAAVIPLTKEEVEEFYIGDKNYGPKDGNFQPEKLPYKEDLKILMKDLEIDDIVLGS
ncbi:unnamed protein product, partial [Allacma fusca]